MATSINFPTSPTTGDTYTYGITTYMWDGVRWNPNFKDRGLSALTDTAIISGITDNYTLKWDSITQKWIPEAVVTVDSVGVNELKDELRASGTTTDVIIEFGQQIYTTAGEYTFTATTSSVSVLCIGGGGGGHSNNADSMGGGGGGLGWKNNIAVVSGNTYTVVVGSGGTKSTRGTTEDATSGGTSYFSGETLVAGYGGGKGLTAPFGTPFPIGGSYTGDGGGNGGDGGYNFNYAGGAGGAGGYSGNGGDGHTASSGAAGLSGSGGGGGGGGDAGPSDTAGGGGGTGLFGEGASGAGGTYGGADGGGGQGGSSGSTGGGIGNLPADGGLYGGGGGGSVFSDNTEAGDGASGAVRIIWGDGASFPSSGTTSGSTTSASTINVDWNDGILFEYTMTGATTVQFENILIGKTITLVIDGNYTLTLPSGVDVADLTSFDGTRTNYIQIHCVDDVGNGVFLASIKNYA